MHRPIFSFPLLSLTALLAANLAHGNEERWRISNPDPLDTHGLFGDRIEIQGDLAIVPSQTAEWASGVPGRVYTYDLRSGGRLATLAPPAGQTNSHFGFDFAADGDLVAIGAPWASESGILSGAVYLYDTRSGAHLRTFLPENTAAGQSFGTAVALDGNILAATGPSSSGVRMAVNHAAELILDLPAIGIGTTGALHFQCLFRDTAAGAGSVNLSDGLTVHFTP